MAAALRYAVREEEFLTVFGAGLFLTNTGTLRRLGIAFVAVRAEEGNA